MAGNFTITMNARDYAALNRKFKEAAKIDRNKTIKSALNEGIMYIKNAGASNLSNRNNVKTGNLKKSLSKRVKKAAAYAGFKRSDKKKNITGGNHAHLVDRGTAMRSYTTKNGKKHSTGSVSRGRPNTGSMFWTDAVETEGPRAQQTLMDGVYNTISKIMNNKK